MTISQLRGGQGSGGVGSSLGGTAGRRQAAAGTKLEVDRDIRVRSMLGGMG